MRYCELVIYLSYYSQLSSMRNMTGLSTTLETSQRLRKMTAMLTVLEHWKRREFLKVPLNRDQLARQDCKEADLVASHPSEPPNNPPKNHRRKKVVKHLLFPRNRLKLLQKLSQNRQKKVPKMKRPRRINFFLLFLLINANIDNYQHQFQIINTKKINIAILQ